MLKKTTFEILIAGEINKKTFYHFSKAAYTLKKI